MQRRFHQYTCDAAVPTAEIPARHLRGTFPCFHRATNSDQQHFAAEVGLARAANTFQRWSAGRGLHVFAGENRFLQVEKLMPAQTTQRTATTNSRTSGHRPTSAGLSATSFTAGSPAFFRRQHLRRQLHFVVTAPSQRGTSSGCPPELLQETGDSRLSRPAREQALYKTLPPPDGFVDPSRLPMRLKLSPVAAGHR